MGYDQEKVASACELASLRASVYSMLSSLYLKELTLDQIKFIHDLDLSGLQDLDPAIAEGAHDISRAVRRVDDRTREDLAVDYAHTFLAAGSAKEETRACPYESVFTSDQGLLMQEARDQVYKYMLDEHLEPDQRMRIPDDHLAFELDFVAAMALRMADAVKSGDMAEAARLAQVQQSFHRDHLTNWVPDFCEAVVKCCRTPFYRGVAKLTEGFIRVEGELIAEAVAAFASR